MVKILTSKEKWLAKIAWKGRSVFEKQLISGKDCRTLDGIMLLSVTDMVSVHCMNNIVFDCIFNLHFNL